MKAVESRNPKWLTIPERGLYTGVAIFGAVGSGKTSACMRPFAQQILSWKAGNPQRRAAGLVLEVKGDFCHDIRQILADAGREEDYIELGMEGRWQWNPLSAEWLDSYSLAYTVSSLLNQLFGKGKEPFWQQAYTNLVRWIIELYRVFPGQWVTLAAGLSLRHRQGTVCGQDSGGRGTPRSSRGHCFYRCQGLHCRTSHHCDPRRENGFRSHHENTQSTTSRTTTPRLRPEAQRTANRIQD